MKRCFHLLSTAVLLSAAAGTASATTVFVTGSLVCGNCDGGPGDDGTINVTFDVTGLPIPYNQENLTAPVSNVDAFASFGDGTSASGTGGYGEVSSDTYEANILGFSAGDISGYIAVPIDWTGSGPLLPDDGENSSLVGAGGHSYYFSGSSSLVTTPEPGSMSLMLLGLSATGGAWFGTGRRRLLGR